MTAFNDIDALFASGAPSFFTKETPVGGSISGPIVSASPIQATDFATKQLETWDDGRPKMLLAVTVASNLHTTPDDNGHRTIYIKTWGEQAKAFKMAVQNACGPTASASQALAVGNLFAAQYTGEIPSQKGSPTKLYAYQIQPVNAGIDQSFGGQQQYTQPPVQQQPQQFGQNQGPAPSWATGQPQQPTPPAPSAPQQGYPQQPGQFQQVPAAPAPIQQAPLPQAPQPAQPVQQAPVAQPVQQQPAPAPPQQAAANPADVARSLIAVGQPDELIAQATGLDVAVIAQLRAAA
ncbi:hypothetical protein ACFSYH_02045 [Populibacterium corticicola]|uniref:Single-stranded DNA-binding protein n=1 Tax=Populibacterium corticicola TaxID=1812826 RepID=A0ABW5XEU3_9MICO